jgi:arabinogalactan oligomer / maltooligosaccharide transport system permease protein
MAMEGTTPTTGAAPKADPRANTPPSGPQGPGTSAGSGRLGRWVRDYGWRHVCAVAALTFAFFPVAYVISASFNPTGSIAAQQLLPETPTVANYQSLFAETPFWQWFWNTIVVAWGAAVVTVFLCACAAYAFSRMRFRGRRGGLLFILLAQMFPPVLAFVAIFLLAVELGNVFPALGVNSRLLLFFIYLGMALSVNTWLMKGFFDTLPVDMDESARIDGASHAQIFFRIILPLATPILSVIFLLTLIATNTDFIIASIILREESSFTLSVGLTQFIAGQYGARWGPFAAGAIIGSLPVIAVFVYLQKYLVSNLTAGAVKG